jgi:hypothetical protein
MDMRVEVLGGKLGDFLEFGTTSCPRLNGEQAPFEEIWREHPNLSTGKPSWVIQSRDGKVFLGRTGGFYMAMKELDDNHFAAVREDLVVETSTWAIKYTFGEVCGLPRLSDRSNPFHEEQRWYAGKAIVIQGADYIVRSIKAV